MRKPVRDQSTPQRRRRRIFGLVLSGTFGTHNLTRARVAVSATFARLGVWWGVGSKWPHLLTQKLRGIERLGKKRSVALDEYFRKHLRRFSVQVKTEVTRGHQWSKFSADCHISSEMCNPLRTYYR